MGIILKNLAAFAVGFVIGDVIAGVIVSKKSRTKLEEELKVQEEYYEKRMSELVDGGYPDDAEKKDEEKAAETVETETVEPPKEYTAHHEDSYTRGRPKSIERTDYGAFYGADPAESEGPREDADYYEGARDVSKSSKDKWPKFIRSEEFGNNPSLSTMQIKYFQDDGTLVLAENDDDTGEILADFDEVEDMIGDALTRFGFASNDEDVIYIRNLEKGCDYCITKIFGSYEDY